ncbi:MAG: hypothetical protein ACI9MR_005218, partial [Myxococcota bacterium]
ESVEGLDALRRLAKSPDTKSIVVGLRREAVIEQFGSPSLAADSELTYRLVDADGGVCLDTVFHFRTEPGRGSVSWTGPAKGRASHCAAFLTDGRAVAPAHAVAESCEPLPLTVAGFEPVFEQVHVTAGRQVPAVIATLRRRRNGFLYCSRHAEIDRGVQFTANVGTNGKTGQVVLAPDGYPAALLTCLKSRLQGIVFGPHDQPSQLTFRMVLRARTYTWPTPAAPGPSESVPTIKRALNHACLAWTRARDGTLRELSILDANGHVVEQSIVRSYGWETLFRRHVVYGQAHGSSLDQHVSWAHDDDGDGTVDSTGKGVLRHGALVSTAASSARDGERHTTYDYGDVNATTLRKPTHLGVTLVVGAESYHDDLADRESYAWSDDGETMCHRFYVRGGCMPGSSQEARYRLNNGRLVATSNARYIFSGDRLVAKHRLDTRGLIPVLVSSTLYVPVNAATRCVTQEQAMPWQQLRL